jgi:hypothetical protein
MSANIKNEKIDVTSILKDVETCIKTGLSNKLGTFFYEYDKYKKTHEEVLNLSIVKELLKSGSYASEDVKPKMDPEHELIVLRNQVIFLRSEVNKYKSRVEAQVPIHTEVQEQEQEQGSSQINLEIKEKDKEMEPLDVKSQDQDVQEEEEDEDQDVQEKEEEEDEEGDGDGDVSVASDLSEDNIQNIVLNVTEKEEADAEVEVEVEAEEEEADAEVEVEVEAEEEEADAEVEVEAEEEEEEEETPVKMPTFPSKNVVEVKPVIAEPEPEAEAEDDVETETEEESDEEVESPREPVKEAEEKEEEEEAAEEEEEEEELYEVEINGVMYVTNDDEDGTIYSYINEEVGDKVGEFKGTFAHIYKGKNKGIYDKTMCKIDI